MLAQISGDMMDMNSVTAERDQLMEQLADATRYIDLLETYVTTTYHVYVTDIILASRA